MKNIFKRKTSLNVKCLQTNISMWFQSIVWGRFQSIVWERLQSIVRERPKHNSSRWSTMKAEIKTTVKSRQLNKTRLFLVIEILSLTLDIEILSLTLVIDILFLALDIEISSLTLVTKTTPRTSNERDRGIISMNGIEELFQMADVEELFHWSWFSTLFVESIPRYFSLKPFLDIFRWVQFSIFFVVDRGMISMKRGWGMISNEQDRGMISMNGIEGWFQWTLQVIYGCLSSLTDYAAWLYGPITQSELNRRSSEKDVGWILSSTLHLIRAMNNIFGRDDHTKLSHEIITWKSRASKSYGWEVYICEPNKRTPDDWWLVTEEIIQEDGYWSQSLTFGYRVYAPPQSLKRF